MGVYRTRPARRRFALERALVVLLVVVAIEVGWVYGSVQWGLW